MPRIHPDFDRLVPAGCWFARVDGDGRDPHIWARSLAGLQRAAKKVRTIAHVDTTAFYVVGHGPDGYTKAYYNHV